MRVSFFFHQDATDQVLMIETLLKGLDDVSLSTSRSNAGPNDILRSLGEALPDLVIIHPQDTSIHLEEAPTTPVIVFSSYLGPSNDAQRAEWDGPMALRLTSRLFTRHLRKIVIGLGMQKAESCQIDTAAFRAIVMDALGVSELPERAEAEPVTEIFTSPHDSGFSDEDEEKIEEIHEENRARHRRSNRQGAFLFAELIRDRCQVADSINNRIVEALQEARVGDADDVQTIRFPILQLEQPAGVGIWPVSRVLVIDDQHRRGWSTLLAVLLHGSTTHLEEPKIGFGKALFARNLGKAVIAAFSSFDFAAEDLEKVILGTIPKGLRLLPYDLAFIDYRLLPEEDSPTFSALETSGSRLVKTLHRIDPSLPVYVFTASQNTATPREAETDLGHYFQKPDPNRKEASSISFEQCIESIELDRKWAWARIIQIGIRHLELMQGGSTGTGRSINPVQSEALARLQQDLDAAWTDARKRSPVSDIVSKFCLFAGFEEYKSPRFREKLKILGFRDHLFQLLVQIRNTTAHRHGSLLDHPLYPALAILSRVAIMARDIVDQEGSVTEILPQIPGYPPTMNLDNSLVSLKELLMSPMLHRDIEDMLTLPGGEENRSDPWKRKDINRRWEILENDIWKLNNPNQMRLMAIPGLSPDRLRAKDLPVLLDWIREALTAENSPEIALVLRGLTNDNSKLLSSVVLAGRLLKISREGKSATGMEKLLSVLALACSCPALEAASALRA